MTFTYLDIETLPSQLPEVAALFRAEVKPPATFKKPESIAEWMAANADQAAADALVKTSFDPGFGHVCTIAWAVDDGDIDVAHAVTVDQERDVLRAFFGSLDKYHSTKFVGHFINGFDVRFLLCRAVVLGVPVPHAIPRDPKPWDARTFDTMTAWSGAKGTISLDRLAAVLGIAGKTGFDGSMVAQAWKDGHHETIIEYCRDDVRIVRDIHRRFIAANW